MNHLFEEHFKAVHLAEISAKYAIRADSIRLIKGDSNLIYDCSDSILRISYSGIRTVSDVEAEIEWLRFLHRKGLSVVRLLPSLNGRLREVIEGRDGYFTAVLFEKIAGSKVEKTTWNITHFEKLGRLTGKLHNANSAYRKRQSTVGLKHWHELVECGYVELLPDDERGLRQLNEGLMQQFQTYGTSPETYGRIHNDIHQENYLLTGPKNKIVLFDFEVACRSWYVYEISTALYYACLINRKRNDTDFERLFLSNFLIGYRTVRNLPPVDFEMVLLFMLYRDIFLLGYMVAMWQYRERPESVISYLKLIDQSITTRRNRLGR